LVFPENSPQISTPKKAASAASLVFGARRGASLERQRLLDALAAERHLRRIDRRDFVDDAAA
jgi:hypothetical protein